MLLNKETKNWMQFSVIPRTAYISKNNKTKYKLNVQMIFR